MAIVWLHRLGGKEERMLGRNVLRLSRWYSVRHNSSTSNLEKQAKELTSQLLVISSCMLCLGSKVVL